MTQDRSDRIPDAAEVAAINATHFADTALVPADLLFVFGTREDAQLRAEKASALWRDGFCRWAIVSGGVTPGAERSECAIIKAEMVARGMPAERILEEHRAQNTGENVIFSLPVIEAALGLHTIRSVICLGNSWTGRRYAMTLHRHWPEATKMLVTIDSFATPRALWHSDAEFRRRVLREWDKIGPYLARGFIAEWP
ncbi:MAG: YdcF family protein [Bradyrhizobium sp.]|uniref:YdcF family protein n=1 Tax=Bradyrhizobium sp. TaxID=376 RepID=UPI003D0EDBC2